MDLGIKCCFLGVGGAFIGLNKSHSQSIFLRPPAALDEKEFMQKCIKCGLCVVGCPYETLSLAGIFEIAPNGTPCFVARKTPCYLCEDFPCVKACPSGALDENSLKTEGKFDIKKAKMGVAIVDDKNCVAYWGIQCDACYRACPLIDEAIFLDYKRNDRSGKHAFLLPIVDSEICVGCGKCERACITEIAAIRVMPLNLVSGKVGQNYVKGWEQSGDKKLKDADTNINLNDKKVFDYLNDGELF